MADTTQGLDLAKLVNKYAGASKKVRAEMWPDVVNAITKLENRAIFAETMIDKIYEHAEYNRKVRADNA